MSPFLPSCSSSNSLFICAFHIIYHPSNRSLTFKQLIFLLLVRELSVSDIHYSGNLRNLLAVDGELRTIVLFSQRSLSVCEGSQL